MNKSDGLPVRTGPRAGYSLGTNRQVADKSIARYALALERAKAGIGGSVAVCDQKLNEWLEYRFRCQQDATLDDEAWL